MTTSRLLPLLLTACALAALSAAACSGAKGGQGGAATVGPRPAGVPESAKPVENDRSFGQIKHRAGGTVEPQDAPRIQSLACAEGVLVIATSGPRIYAALACENFPPQVSALQGEQAAIRLQVDPRKLFLESERGEQAEFSPRDMWVE